MNLAETESKLEKAAVNHTDLSHSDIPDFFIRTRFFSKKSMKCRLIPSHIVQESQNELDNFLTHIFHPSTKFHGNPAK